MRNCYQDKSSTNNVTYVYCRTLRYVSSKKQQQNSNSIPYKLCLTPSYVPDTKWSPQTHLQDLPFYLVLIRASQVVRHSRLAFWASISTLLREYDNILCPSLCWNDLSSQAPHKSSPLSKNFEITLHLVLGHIRFVSRNHVR